MGNNNSLVRCDAFTSAEISRLQKRFKKLDTDQSGSVSIAEFLTVPELKQVQKNFFLMFRVHHFYAISPEI